MKTLLVATALCLSTLGALTPLSARAAKAHEHGAAKIDVAIEAGKLSIGLETPLDGLLGFERAPRTEAERQQVAKMVGTLKAADKLFVIDPAAQCSLGAVELTSAPLKLGKAPAAKDEDGHGDLDASFEFSCKNAPAFIDVGLFSAFPRLSRIEVQTATPKGQRKLVLKRSAVRIDLNR
jgi:Protein of unknown function (DUF2796)